MSRNLCFKLFIILSYGIIWSSEIPFPYPATQEFNLAASASIKSVYEALRMNDLPASRDRLVHIRQSSADPSEQAWANFYLCMLHLDLDQIDRAKRYLDVLNRTEAPEPLKVRARTSYDIHVAWYYLRKRQWSRAQNLFVAAIQLDDHISLKNYISNIYLNRTKFMERGRDLRWKTNLLKQSLVLNSGHVDTLITLVRVLEKQKLQHEAVPYLQTLVSIKPDPALRIKLADWLALQDKASNAFSLYKNLHLEFPENKEYMNKFLQLGKALQVSSDEEISLPVSVLQDREMLELDQVNQLMALGKFEEAQKILENRIQDRPGEWDSVEKLVRLMLTEKKNKEAHKLLMDKPQFGDLPQYKVALANVLERIDPVECEMFVLSLDLKEKFSPLQILKLKETLGKAYLKQSRLDRAKEVFEDLLDPKWQHLNHQDVAHFYLGVYYGQLKYFQKSLYHYRTADRLKPNQAKYLLAVATSMRQLGLQTQSVELIQRLIRDFPHSKYAGYARKLFQLPEPTEADKKTVKLDSNLPPYIATFLWMKDHDPLDLNPENLNLLLDKLEISRQWDRLIETLERILDVRYNTLLKQRLEKLYSNYSKLNHKYVLKAQTYNDSFLNWFSQKDISTSLTFLDHLDPSVELDDVLQMQFAKFLQSQKNYERALQLYQNLRLQKLSAPLNQSDVLASMGYCNYMLKNLDKALENYYQALNLDPNNVNLLFQLAELLQANGDLQKARLIYQEIQSLNQSDQSVRDAAFYLRQLQGNRAENSDLKRKE